MPQRPQVADRQRPHCCRLFCRRVDDGVATGAIPASQVYRDQPMVQRAIVTARMEGSYRSSAAMTRVL
jgi:hypothetical protein